MCIVNPEIKLFLKYKAGSACVLQMCSKHKKNGLSAGLLACTRHLLHACAMAGSGGEGRGEEGRGAVGGLEREHSYRRRGYLERCCRVNVNCPSKLHAGLQLIFRSPVF